MRHTGTLVSSRVDPVGIAVKIRDHLTSSRAFREVGHASVPLDDAQRQAVASFNADLAAGSIETEAVDCLCGTDEFSLIATVDRYGLSQSTVICTACGLIQSNPRLTSGEYERFYASDRYRLIYEGSDYLALAEDRYTLGYGESIYTGVADTVDVAHVGTVLEFGAGGGWNLLPFVDGSRRVTGYDFSAGLVEMGRKKGLDLHQGGIDAIEGTFDLVIANHVIEHLPSVVTDVGRLGQHLTDRGVLYVGVPNIRNFAIEQIQNAHTYYFTPETLVRYVSEAGLEPIAHRAEPNGHMAGLFRRATATASRPASLEGHYDEMVQLIRSHERIRAFADRYRLGRPLRAAARLRGALPRRSE